MTIVYFDSSAFVKLVVEEDGSEVAATLWDGCDAAVSSRLAYPEVRAALAAAGRAFPVSLGVIIWRLSGDARPNGFCPALR